MSFATDSEVLLGEVAAISWAEVPPPVPAGCTQQSYCSVSDVMVLSESNQETQACMQLREVSWSDVETDVQQPEQSYTLHVSIVVYAYGTYTRTVVVGRCRRLRRTRRDPSVIMSVPYVCACL